MRKQVIFVIFIIFELGPNQPRDNFWHLIAEPRWYNFCYCYAELWFEKGQVDSTHYLAFEVQVKLTWLWNYLALKLGVKLLGFYAHYSKSLQYDYSIPIRCSSHIFT